MPVGGGACGGGDGVFLGQHRMERCHKNQKHQRGSDCSCFCFEERHLYFPFSYISHLVFFTSSEADRENECQIGVSDLGRRRWKRRGTSQQGERLGIEHGGSGGFLNPAGHDVALPIDGKGETDHPLGRVGLRWVSVVACQTCQQRLMPFGDCRRTGRRCGFLCGGALRRIWFCRVCLRDPRHC